MAIVIEARYGAEGVRHLDRLLDRAHVTVVPVDLEQGKPARLEVPSSVALSKRPTWGDVRVVGRREQLHARIHFAAAVRRRTSSNQFWTITSSVGGGSERVMRKRLASGATA